MRHAPKFDDISTRQVMNRVTAPGMPFQWSINPYRGCTHGCSFCYARVTHTYLGMGADDTFRSRIFVKADAPDVLAEQLERRLRRLGGDMDRLVREVGLVTLGTATDPYQPIEARRKLTRQCLNVLAAYQVPTSITTRSPLILRDIDILKQVRLHAINISVHTLDKQVWRRLEPATPAPEKRLAAVRKLAANGLPVGVFLAPIVPYLTDSTSELRAVVEAAKAADARFLVPSVLRLVPEVKHWFLQTLREHYPHLLAPYRRLYRRAYPPASYVDPVLRRARALMAEMGLESRIPAEVRPSPSLAVPTETAEVSTAGVLAGTDAGHGRCRQLVLPI